MTTLWLAQRKRLWEAVKALAGNAIPTSKGIDWPYEETHLKCEYPRKALRVVVTEERKERCIFATVYVFHADAAQLWQKGGRAHLGSMLMKNEFIIDENECPRRQGAEFYDTELPTEFMMAAFDAFRDMTQAAKAASEAAAKAALAAMAAIS